MPIESTVVITGASSGIGRACASHLDGLGWRVFAGVRQDADAVSLRAEASSRLVPIMLDVTDPRSIYKARERVQQSVGERGLSGLINNAGIPYGGPIEYLDLKEVRRVFEVNFFGLIAATQSFLPLLRQGRGRIVNMSSISGWVASPFLSPYSSSKFALEALSDALRVELHPWDLKVALVEPGAIDTPIWNKGADILKDVLNDSSPDGMQLYSDVIHAMEGSIKPHGISSERVAKAVAHALTSRHPKTRYAVGPDARLVQFFRFLPDRLRDAYFVSQVHKR